MTKECFTLKEASRADLHSVLRKCAFTLAEVLITLGIIGVVAAMTIPTLIANQQKKYYYSRFMKARSTLENALKLYAHERNCDEDPLCGAWLADPINDNFALELSKYFKGATLITEDNYEEICKGYKKVRPRYNSTYVYDEDMRLLCGNPIGSNASVYGFVTIDGMLFSFYQDLGIAEASLLDINGPNNGPNTFGRDMFIFYVPQVMRKDFCGSMWGLSKECYDKQPHHVEFTCCDDCEDYSQDCGARLIEEGKMNY